MDMPTSSAPYRDPAPFSISAQGQDLVFYPDGQDRLAALLAVIDGARESLRVCFYIFSQDATGIRVRDALVAAARRGVMVHLMVDGFGADATKDFFADLAHDGGTFCIFSPRRTVRYLIRNHQKMVIADGRIAMFGGFNVEDDYFAAPQMNGWNDLGLTIEGSAVAELIEWYDSLRAWTEDPKAQFRAIRRLVREWHPGHGPVRWLMGGPTKGLSTWARCVSVDLKRATRLDMIMAYFSPAAWQARRIGKLARRGDARLLLAAKSDNGATLGASRLLYGKLLKNGAKIWEFSPCKLHTKLIVVDDTVYVGSANFDIRSLYINLELMLRIEDAALADRMREFVSWHLSVSQRITPEVHRRRGTLLTRIRWVLSWLLVGVVDYTVSRKLNLGL